MLNPDDPQWTEDQDQQELGIGDRPSHNSEYPFIQEFSEFISTVPTKALLYTLMTYQQRLLAKALWEAENYGGSESKCIERLKDIYGPCWRQLVDFREHMKPLREYCEYVLMLDHQNQWNRRRKVVTLNEIIDTDAGSDDRCVAGQPGRNPVRTNSKQRKRISKL